MTETIVFVVPTSISGQVGPVASWLNTAGWASAARDLGFMSMVVTPRGVVDVATLRRTASISSLGNGSRRRTVSFLPAWLKVAVKDVRELLRSISFSRSVASTAFPSDVAFVWQRHELFHRSGQQLARRLGCPFVLYVPAPKVWEARQWGVTRPGWGSVLEMVAERSLLLSADLVACVSVEVASVVEAMGVLPERIVVVPSTVDTTLFDPEAVDPGDVRARLGVSDRFVVGWTGSFRGFHGLEPLIDAMDKLHREVPEACLLLIGDGPERRRLEEAVESRGLESWVRFLGTLAQDELPEILSGCDVAVVLGRFDQSFHYSPLKLWEYLAMARPVVAAAPGSTFKMLTDERDVVLVDPGDSSALADALIRLRNDPDLRHRLGVRARETAVQHSWTRQLETLERRLQHLDASRAP